MAQEATQSAPAMTNKEVTTDIGGTWQAEKSAMTRKAVLDATIRCFLKLGYANTTTSKIADEAGLSRGAMLHHFPSRDKLIAATVDHLNAIRIQNYRDLIQGIDPTAEDRIDLGIDAYWKHLTSDSFVAFHELIIASRADADLERILVPKIKQFETEWAENTHKLFPEWEPTGEILELAMDLTQYLMEGMAVNRMTMTHHQEERMARLLKFLKSRLREIFEMGLRGESLEAVLKTT